MKQLARWITAIALLGMSGVFAFGFYASFELGIFSVWHVIYGVTGVLFLTAAMRLVVRKTWMPKGLFLARLVAFAAMAFLTMVLLMWLWATGGGHAPWPPA